MKELNYNLINSLILITVEILIQIDRGLIHNKEIVCLIKDKLRKM